MRVLVVEDEKKTASFIRKALQAEGFAVDVCHNGDDAWAAARTTPFDAIVLDIMLPGRDGLSLLRQLRERKNATPVLLLGFDPGITVGTAVFFTFYAIFLHADVDWDFGPLRSVISTPVFHRWHHSKDPQAIDKNFAGLLPLWDILFGTYYMPRDRMPCDFGVPEKVPTGYFGQLWHPFAGWFGRKGPPPPRA